MAFSPQRRQSTSATLRLTAIACLGIQLTSDVNIIRPRGNGGKGTDYSAEQY